MRLLIAGNSRKQRGQFSRSLNDCNWNQELRRQCGHCVRMPALNIPFSMKWSYQDPVPELVGNWWQIRVYRDEYVNERRVRKRKRIRLVPASMPVREVQKLKAEYLRSLNQGLISEGGATPFESFVRNVYEMTDLDLMASTTQERYRGIIDHYLVPTFGSVCLRDISSLVLQKYILGFEIVEPDGGKPRTEVLQAASLVSRLTRSGM